MWGLGETDKGGVNTFGGRRLPSIGLIQQVIGDYLYKSAGTYNNY